MHLIGRSLFHFTIIGRIGPPPCESREHPFRGGVRRVAPYRRPPMLNRISFFRRISISRVVFRRSGEWRHRCPASCFVPAFHADHVRPPREPVNRRLERCPQWAKRSGASGSGRGTRFQSGCPRILGIALIKIVADGEVTIVASPVLAWAAKGGSIAPPVFPLTGCRLQAADT